MPLIALPPPADWTLDSGLELVDSFGIRLKSDGGDEFGLATQQDLKAGGDGAKSHGISVLNTASAYAMDVNITAEGKLSIACNTIGSQTYQATFTGPFVYWPITGDFERIIKIPPTQNENYNRIGLLARDPAASAGEDWVAMFRAWADGDIQANMWNNVNNVTTQYNSMNNPKFLKLKRVGNNISGYWKANEGDSWTLRQTVTRADFASNIQVGIYMNTWNSDANNGYIAMAEYFRNVFLTGQIAEAPWIPVDQNTFDAAIPINILENKIATLLGEAQLGNLRYQWAANNGSYNGSWLTHAQLLTALQSLANTNHTNSLRFKIQFNSDGYQQADASGFGSYVKASGVSGGGNVIMIDEGVMR